MVVEYNDEYCKIILREDINTEPYEVIDIVDLLEVWEKHKKEVLNEIACSTEIRQSDACHTVQKL